MAGKKKTEAQSEPSAGELNPADASNKEVLRIGGVDRVVLLSWTWGDTTRALIWNSEDNSLAVTNLNELEAEAEAEAESGDDDHDEGEGDAA